MTLKTISPENFKTYMLLVETSLPLAQVAVELGISENRVKQRQRVLFDLLGVDSRLALMSQYHSREARGMRSI